MLAIISLFRNCSQSHLERYFTQISALNRLIPLRLICVEGDSTNNTREYLRARQISSFIDGSGPTLDLVVREHGGPHYGSVDTPERMAALSYVADGGLERVTSSDSYALIIESDLIWSAPTISRLINVLDTNPTVGIIAPALLVDGTLVHYDIWGYRTLSGAMFSGLAPYAPGLDPAALYEVSSVGSCVLMRTEIAQRCRMSPSKLALVGFCADARSKGFRIYADFSQTVYHPR